MFSMQHALLRLLQLLQLLHCLLLIPLPAVIFAKFVNVLLMEFEHLLRTRVFAFVILCDLSRVCATLCKDLV